MEFIMPEETQREYCCKEFKNAYEEFAFEKFEGKYYLHIMNDKPYYPIIYCFNCGKKPLKPWGG